jgi:hypothetical protein
MQIARGWFTFCSGYQRNFISGHACISYMAKVPEPTQFRGLFASTKQARCERRTGQESRLSGNVDQSTRIPKLASAGDASHPVNERKGLLAKARKMSSKGFIQIG